MRTRGRFEGMMKRCAGRKVRACPRVGGHGSLVFGVMWVLALLSGCDRPAQQAKPSVEHVVIVSVDGLRPDMMLRTNTPVMKSMMRNGCYTMWARTTEVSITLPSHVSMLTGVVP